MRRRGVDDHRSSPRIGAIVAPWFAPRYEQGGIYEAIAKARTNRLYDLVWQSGSAHAPFHARHVRLIVSLGVPVPGHVTDAELTECRDGLMGMLNSLGLASNALEPAGLLELVDELIDMPIHGLFASIRLRRKQFKGQPKLARTKVFCDRHARWIDCDAEDCRADMRK